MKLSLFILFAVVVAINAVPVVDHHRSRRQVAAGLTPLSRLPETAVHALGGPGFGFGFAPGFLGVGGFGGLGGIGGIGGGANAFGMAGFGLPFG
jgi:hypothetical protein